MHEELPRGLRDVALVLQKGLKRAEQFRTALEDAIKGRAALAGMSVGLALVLMVRFATAIAWPWYTVIGSLTTFAVGALIPEREHAQA